MSTVRVALLGCGNVGSEVARLLTDHADDLAARIGARLELIGVAVRRIGRDRSASGLDPLLFTTDAVGLVTRADVDVVVELIGGIEPARSLVRRDVATIAPDAPLAEALATLDEHAERRLVVLDRGGPRPRGLP